MARLEWDLHSALPPERILEALTDFSDSRPDQWEGLSREYYEVYAVGETTADVKEGTKGFPMSVWAREAYDWSIPGTVKWIVQDSNFVKAGYGVTATVTPNEGGSNVHIVWERIPKTLRAKIAIRLLSSRDGKMIKKLVKKSFDNLPAEWPSRTD